MNLLPERDSKRLVFKTDFMPTPKQAEADLSTARFKILRWGRKTGKTTYAERRALKGLGPPNSVWWHIAPTYKQAKLISWEKFKRIIPQAAFGKKPNDVDLTITLKNGSQLFLMGSDDPNSLRGPEPDGMTLEEAAYHKRGVWSEVLRPALMPKQGPALFISTPAGFNWFKDLEDEAKRRISLGDKEWFISHATCFDNPYLSKDEIKESRKDCASEQVWRQEYLAEYESSVGRVFSEFDGTKHMKKVSVPLGNFECYRAIDWGMRDNTACLWAYSQNSKLYIYREYLGNNLSAPAQAKIIKDMTGRNEQVKRTAISHDSAKEDPAMRGLTVLWHFRQAGISPLQPSTRDKKHSRAMINQLIQENRLVIDLEKCPKLRKQLLSYEWKDTTMEKPDDLGDDDAVDALHYLVEMLQFDLFMNRKKDDVFSRDQMYAEIAKERLESWRHPSTTVPSIFNPHEEFGTQMEDTAAGYL
jgi:hypothetical protein